MYRLNFLKNVNQTLNQFLPIRDLSSNSQFDQFWNKIGGCWQSFDKKIKIMGVLN